MAQRAERTVQAVITALTPGRILVLGGTGHLGSTLVHALVRDEGVRAADIRVFFLRGSPTAHLQDLPGLELVPGEILDPGQVADACRGVRLVFHMVADLSFDPRQRMRQWLTNVEGTRNVLRAALANAGVERLCHTSTVNTLAVPDPPGSLGELAGCDPYRGARPGGGQSSSARRARGAPRLHSFGSAREILDFADAIHAGTLPPGAIRRKVRIGYFDSKLAAQELVNRAVSEEGLDAVSVLPGTMFGPSASPAGAGMYLTALYGNRLPAMLRGGLPLMHVADAAEGHILAMRRGSKGSRYIVTGRVEDNRTLLDMAGIIVEVLQQAFPQRRFRRPAAICPELALAAAGVAELGALLTGGPAGLTRSMVRAGSALLFYSCERAQRELGYAPKRAFRQAVEEMVRYFAGHGLFE
jgi:dihydroflavonol-4-reductase